jgi:hypothetical protein
MKGSRKADWVEGVVNKAEFLSVIRFLRKMYPCGLPDLRLTVGNGVMTFEFPTGGALLKCKSDDVIVADVPGKTLRRIVKAHGIQKWPQGETTIVFRPKLQIIATQLAGGGQLVMT